MKKVACIMAAVLLAMEFSRACSQDSVSDADLLRIASRLEVLSRVTPRPAQMLPPIGKACESPFQSDTTHKQLVSAKDSVIHVYVSPGAVENMRARETTAFPEGTLVVKEKYFDPSATQVVLYTGMLKHAKGYNPQCGDWEFFVMSGDRKSLVARGRIDSCMSCHVKHSATDYVTRLYPIDGKQR